MLSHQPDFQDIRIPLNRFAYLLKSALVPRIGLFQFFVLANDISELRQFKIFQNIVTKL